MISLIAVSLFYLMVFTFIVWAAVKVWMVVRDNEDER
jgi:hypothetical protein